MDRRILIVCVLILSLVLGQASFAFGATSSSDKPKAPTMNSAVLADDGSVDVVWSKVSGADKYEIYRATSKDGKYKKIATVSSKNRIYNDTDVELYKNYYYKLKTVEGGKKSGYSKVVSAYVEGPVIYNSKIDFTIRFEDGEKTTRRSGGGVTTTACPLNCTLNYNGKVATDYDILYDKANVTIKKGKNGQFEIKPKTAGSYLFTFVIGEDKGTFSYHAELADNSALTFSWLQNDAEQNSMSVKFPKFRESELKIKYKGKTIKDFKVTSSNKNVCTVKKNGSKVTVTNKKPGKCNLTFTYKGQKTVFKWVVKRGMATAPYIYVDGVTVSDSLADKNAESLVEEFTHTEYSQKEIKALAKLDMTLEEAAEKILTVQDAVNYLSAKGMRFGYSYNPNLDVGNIRWGSHLSAKFTYEHLAGCCGAISNLMNILLEGDYDSQGYVNHTSNYGGHTYSFFIKDGFYYICDFTKCFKRDKTYTDKALYLMLVTDDINELLDYYKLIFPDYDNPDYEDYLYNLYAYELDGYENLVRGRDPNNCRYTAVGDPICNYLPDTIKDTVHMLYVEDSLEIIFAKAPTRDMYPPEVNIPED